MDAVDAVEERLEATPVDCDKCHTRKKALLV